METYTQVILKSFDGKTEVLQSLCHSITDCDHSTPQWTPTGKIVVRNFNIKNGRLLLDKLSFTDEETFKTRTARSKPESGDLIITREAPMGEICIIPKGIDCCLGQRVVLIKPNSEKIDSEYLLYAIQSEFVQKQIKKSEKTGSTVSNLRIPDLKAILIPVTKSQQKIASVLSVLDTKIELNNRINTELEAMAKTLYDYWFVQFDFPDANGKPYKASGGKMVYNATLKREIPEGWQNANVLQVANLHGGGTPTKVKADYWHGEIPFFTPSDSDNNIFSLKTEDYITEKGLKNSSTKLFQKNTVFITARGSVGRLALNSVPMAMNQSCYALQAKEGISYAYLFFLTKELIHHLQVKASGSVFNSIVSSDIKHTNLAIPGSVKLIDVYKKIAEPTFEKINLITTENNQLETLRDYLLPMLMNGQVTVTS